MKAITTAIPDLLIIEPKVFGDERGFFFESFNQRNFNDLVGCEVGFVQDNHSKSVKNTLRGLHYQIQHPQGKLVRVIQGAVFDVAVDLRQSSPSFGKFFSLELSASNMKMMWIPEGFAHGFLALTETAEVLYKSTDYWAPNCERSIIWNDPIINVNWPVQGAPVISAKDNAAKFFLDAEYFK